MNMKKKMKAFFTMNRHANEGFTLVELIVVIAILAILAGVAVPAYSGYIEKAERAADEVLLSEVNTAFAAACIMSGESHTGRSDVAAGIINKKFAYTKPFADEFAYFYEGEEKEFNVITSVLYDAATGTFKDPLTAETLTLSYGGGFVQVTGEAIAALKDSTFYDKMDSTLLLQQVASVAGITGGMGTMANVRNSEGYVNAALKALNLDTTGTLEEKVARMNARARELALENLGWTEADVNAYNQDQLFAKMDEIGNNALVLYAAQSTSNMDVADAKNMLNGITSDVIKNAMNTGSSDVKAEGMNQAALAYGMYFAYIHSDACTDENLKATADNHVVDIDELVAELDNENSGFRKYMNTAQGEKDMEAYLQALRVVNSSTQDTAAVEKLVVNGFDDPDLIAILVGAMGK